MIYTVGVEYPFKILLILFMLVVASYFTFMYFESTAIPKSVDISTFEGFSTLPPAQCQFSSSNDRESISGELHIFNKVTRLDYVYNSLGRSNVIHVIVNSEGVAFAWNDNSKTGLRGSYNGMANQLNLSKAGKAKCSVWWIPFGDTLTVPTDISFDIPRS